VPTPERIVNIPSVVAFKTLLERTLLIFPLDRPDTCQAKIFDKDMWCFEYQAKNALSLATARIDQGN
jgi:hypothetical protein